MARIVFGLVVFNRWRKVIVCTFEGGFCEMNGIKLLYAIVCVISNKPTFIEYIQILKGNGWMY